MLYLDTSLLVAALTNEAQTGRMQRWLGEQQAEHLAISDWLVTEFSSALSIKLRSAQIEARDRAEVLATFARESLGLRAGDALHPAICADRGATLCTLDRQLSNAGSVLGVKALLL